MQADGATNQQQEQRQWQVPTEPAEPRFAGLTVPPENPDRARLFQLSGEERRLALELKAAVEADEELEPLPDLQYVQFVITFGGDLKATLERVRGLQAFRHEYKINDTIEEGMILVSAFTREHPGCLLSFAYDDETENYGGIYDRSRMNHQILKTDQNWRVFLGSAFYIFNALCPDPHSMRQGVFFIAECQDTQSQKMSVDALQQCWYHFLHHVPVFLRSILFFHTNTVANLSYSLMKPFMRHDVRNRITVGCQLGVNLSSLYLLPTPEMATQRILMRFADFMTTRYENQESFSLS